MGFKFSMGIKFFFKEIYLKIDGDKVFLIGINIYFLMAINFFELGINFF